MVSRIAKDNQGPKDRGLEVGEIQLQKTKIHSGMQSVKSLSVP